MGDESFYKDLYARFERGEFLPSDDKDFHDLAAAISRFVPEEKLVENWDGYVPFLIDGAMADTALSTLEKAGPKEDYFLWDYLYSMALYRSAVIENRSDDVEYDPSCGDILGTLRKARSYASKARSLAPERFLPDLDRLDAVTSRALIVARMKGMR